MIVQGSEQASVDQSRGPDHSGGGDEETVEETAIPNPSIWVEIHEDLESPAKVLAVKGTLSEQDISM